MADVFELKYDINLDYSKSLKDMKDTIGNFDIKIPIDVDSKSLEDVKKQVDSLEKKPQKISIQLDAKSYDKQLETMQNSAGKIAKEIGEAFEKNIREGMSDGLKQIDVKKLIREKGGKNLTKDNINGILREPSAVITEEIPKESIKELVEYSERLEYLKNLIEQIQKNKKGDLINLGQFGGAENVLAEIQKRFESIGAILSDKGNIQQYTQEINTMFENTKSNINALAKSLAEGLNVDEVMKDNAVSEQMKNELQGVLDTIEEYQKKIKDATTKLEDALSLKDIKSKSKIKKSDFEDLIMTALNGYNNIPFDSDIDRDDVAQKIADLYETYVSSYDNANEEIGKKLEEVLQDAGNHQAIELTKTQINNVIDTIKSMYDEQLDAFKNGMQELEQKKSDLMQTIENQQKSGGSGGTGGSGGSGESVPVNATINKEQIAQDIQDAITEHGPFSVDIKVSDESHESLDKFGDELFEITNAERNIKITINKGDSEEELQDDDKKAQIVNEIQSLLSKKSFDISFNAYDALYDDENGLIKKVETALKNGYFSISVHPDGDTPDNWSDWFKDNVVVYVDVIPADDDYADFIMRIGDAANTALFDEFKKEHIINVKPSDNLHQQIVDLIGREAITVNIKPIMPQKPERTNKTTITRERANGDTVTTESSQTTGGAATATSNIDNSFNRGTDNVNKYDNAVGGLLESLRKVGTEIDKIATNSSKVAKVDVVDEQEIDQVYRLGELLDPDKFVTTAPATKLKEAFKDFNAYLVKGENLNDLSQAGTIAAYKYFKAFEEALKKHGGKNVAESTLKEFTIKEYIDGFTGQSEFFKKVKGADDKDAYMMTDKLKQNIDDLTTSLKNMRTMYDYIFEKHGAWDFSKLAPNFKTFKDMDGYMKYYLGLFQQVEEIKQRLTGDSRESELQAVYNKIEKYKVNMDRVLTGLEGKDKSDSISSLVSDIDQVKQHIESLNAESEPIITQQEKDQTIQALDEIIAKVESVGDSFGKGFNTEQLLASLNNMKTQVSNMDTSLIASDGSIQLPVNITFSFEKFYKELQDKLAQAEELKPKLTIDGIEQLEKLKGLINEELPKAVTDVVSKFSSISGDIQAQATAFQNLAKEIGEANKELTAFISNQNKKNFSTKEVKVKFEAIQTMKNNLDEKLEKVNSSIAVKPIVDDKAFKNVQNKIDELKNQLHDFYSKVNPIQSIKLDEPAMQTILAKYQRYLQQFQETGDKNAFINALAQKPTKLNKINTFDVEELRKVARRIIPSDARQGADINKMTKSELARIIGESESQNLFLNEEFRQITTLLSTHIPNALKTMVEAFTKAETEVVQIMGNMKNAISPIERAIATMSTQNFIDPVRMSEIFRQLNNVLKNDDVKRVVDNLEQIRSKFVDFYEMDLSKSNIFTTIDNILKKSEELNKLMEVLKKQADVRQTARDTNANAKTQSEIDKEREIAQSKSEAINARITAMQEEELKRNNEILISIVKMKDAYDNLTSAIITTQKVNEQGQFLGVNRYSIGARKDPDSENEDDYITYTTTVNEEQYKKYIDDYLNKYKSFVSEYISLQSKMDSVRQNGGIVDDTVIRRFQFLRSEIMQMAEAFAELNDVSDDALDKFNKTNVGLNIDLNMRDTKIDRRREKERERQEQIYTKDEEAWDRQRTTTQQRTTRNAINTLTTEQANAEKEAMNNVIKAMSQYEEVSKRIARDKALAGDVQEADRLQDRVYILVDSFKELYSAKGHEKLITMLDEIEARLDVIRRITQATSYEKEWARHIRELEKEHKESVKQIERQDKKDWSDELSEYRRLISEYVKIRKDLANGKLGDTTEYKKQADILSYRIGMTQNSLKGNALFDQNQYDQATQPLKMLSEELDKINKKIKDSDARKVASETEEKAKNIKNEIEEATKAIEKYEKAMQRVKTIQDKIDVGNLDGSKNSTQATLRSAQQRALEAKSEVDNLNLLRYRLPDEANASYANANALYADYMSENQNQERYLDNAADLYRNLIKYAEEYYGLIYKQDTGKTLTYNESKRLEYLDSLYKKAIDNADALQKKLSGEDVNLPDDAIAAADYAKQKPIMEQYESLGKTISKYGDVQGNENYNTWLDSVNDRYKKIKMMIDSINWFPENDAQKDKLIDDVKAVEDEIQKLQKNAKNERKAMAPSFSNVSETAKETLNRQMDQWISQNTAAKGAIQQIREYQRQLMSVTDKGALEKVKAGFEKVKREAIAAGETGLTFGEKLQKSMGNLARYLLSFVSFYRIVGTIKQGIEVVKELDSALKEVRMVAKESGQYLKDWQLSTFDAAKEVGGTALEIQKSVASWIRLGCSESYSPTIQRYIC